MFDHFCKMNESEEKKTENYGQNVRRVVQLIGTSDLNFFSYSFFFFATYTFLMLLILFLLLNELLHDTNGDGGGGSAAATMTTTTTTTYVFARLFFALFLFNKIIKPV